MFLRCYFFAIDDFMDDALFGAGCFGRGVTFLTSSRGAFWR